MRNLLSIESALFNEVSVANQIGGSLRDIESLISGVADAKKVKFEKSLQLSEIVVKSWKWFNSAQGKTQMDDYGVTWTKEDFYTKLYGWKKSFFYKMLKVGKLQNEQPETVAQFKNAVAEADANGDSASMSVASLLKFASNGGETTETASAERTSTVFTMTFKGDTNVSVRIDDQGKVVTTNGAEDIAKAIEFLASKLS